MVSKSISIIMLIRNYDRFLTNYSLCSVEIEKPHVFARNKVNFRLI